MYEYLTDSLGLHDGTVDRDCAQLGQNYANKKEFIHFTNMGSKALRDTKPCLFCCVRCSFAVFFETKAKPKHGQTKGKDDLSSPCVSKVRMRN